ncbi:xanthine dehydrogenase family protein molybdopterin-binding subunit [Ancylobacter lacus]|uniref:xanthine dehydrogenase family protein molybdopterin-binding subunit n=1 Tax=Ancylobacter lacus TaxID=2579970 RepID=UPI001BCBFEB7|nr:molybdopterin cofactor-binding domain-containing protein [Ancylobacter lacus]MBS7539896.1 xanthine dehydrogenase family protein molybdopterin-binding subunit [Ancylobacter lacus]
MNMLLRPSPSQSALPLKSEGITNLSRRRFLGAGAGALVLGALLPALPHRALAQATANTVKPGTRIPAFLIVGRDNSFKLLSPFVEGGQGVSTGQAQMVGEELDVEPSRFVVECAPPGPDYAVIGGLRLTGGSFSTRSSYEVMRRLGATAREMFLRAAAARLDVPASELTTENGVVIHAASGRHVPYGEVAEAALALTPAENVPLRDPKTFRYIRQPLPRLDARDKSTGKAVYAIDQKLDGMLYAAVQHAPHLGTEPVSFANEAAVRAMPGVHGVHRLPGAVAVTADSWFRARKAVETLDVTWTRPEATGLKTVAADYSSEAMLAALKESKAAAVSAEKAGDAAAVFAAATRIVEAEYAAPYLAHAQLEPPSAMARFNPDGTLELWTPNQMPELFQSIAAKTAGLSPEKVILHSPILGGFFGRHFFYGAASPFPQAILLAKETGRPVKVLWSREEEFRMDALRPLSFTRFRAALGADGRPAALEARTVGEGPTGRYFGALFGGPVDGSAVEGLVEKPYAIADRSLDYVKLLHPVTIAFWRSVGHSMNDYFYEGFFDEVADAGGHDPFQLRLDLLKDRRRHLKLLQTVADLSGGWKRGPFDAEGGRRARGVAMASPFGSETATIAEVSLADGQVRVHDIWIAFDPGSIVNPGIIRSQVESAAALGVSTALFEEMVYADGVRQASNFDGYTILGRDHMPRIHVEIVESGEPMGGVGEPGLPGVVAAVVNAVAALTGRHIRTLPLSRTKFNA